MVGCIVTLIGLLTPRLAMFLIWIFSDWFGQVFDGALWPVLGFLFMPYTTLAYMAAMLRAGDVAGGWLVLLVVAVIVDFGNWGGAGMVRRGRR